MMLNFELISLLQDDRAETSWTAKIGDVSWVESLEVQVINVSRPKIPQKIGGFSGFSTN